MSLKVNLFLVFLLLSTSNSFADVQCNPPVWTTLPGYLGFPENTAIGSYITTISATGLNSEAPTIYYAPGDVLTKERVTFNTSTTGYSTTAKLYLKSPMDWDQGFTTWNLFFVAYDTCSSKNNVPLSKVTINILDVNDNPPRFNEQFYQVTVPENTHPGTVINHVLATDADNGNGAKFTFTLKAVGQSSSLYHDAFSITTTNVNNNRSGQVTLRSSLDYEKLSFYQYVVIATDSGGLSSTASLVIDVGDIQDTPPYFQRLPYVTSIDENVNNSTVLPITALALDGDIGVPNNISYHIKNTGKCYHLFRIDQNTGQMYTNTTNLNRDRPPLTDADVDGVCSLIIEAREVNTSGQHQFGNNITTTPLVITIKDENDNSPVFTEPLYTAKVTENTTNIPLTVINQSSIHVSDNDQMGNNEFTITVLYSNGTDFTGIEPIPKTVRGSSDITLRLRDDFVFDYEQNHNLTIKLVATETTNSSSSSECSVNIQIEDINDNVPVLSSSHYVAFAQENNPRGHNKNQTILNITATDEDSGKRGEITYSLGGGDPNFVVEQVNNSLAQIKAVVVANDLIDRETKDKYTLSVEATDGEGSRSSARIVVYITDINDYAPQFVQGYRQFSVAENQQHFQKEIVINATDNDQSNLTNSEIVYRLVPPSYLTNNFTINNRTGQIKLTSSLDFERLNNSEGSITLMIEAYDLGSPPLTSTTSIIINVQDVNDNTPEFTKNQYSMTVTENSKQGTWVGQVKAADKDGTETNSKISYYILKGSDKFRMEGNTGEITVDFSADIDRETSPFFNLSVLAVDRGTPARNSSTLVYVTVLDQNDEPPTFDKVSFVANINESASKNTVITTCRASDKDDDFLLAYSIINATAEYTQPNANNPRGTDIMDHFRIGDNGTVYLMTQIDREVFSSVTLYLNVTDLNGTVNIPQTALATLTITVLDANDNPPEFVSIPEDQLQIREGKLSGILFTLSATDKDIDTGFVFSIKHSPLDAFYIDDPRKGTIKRNVSVELDRETNTTLQMTVSVSDSLHVTTKNLTLTVVDINDNSPIFQPSTITSNITENNGSEKYNSYHLISLNASDRDAGPNANLTYYIDKGNQTDLFSIPVATKCEIYVNGNIDRERISRYILIIIAKDNPRDHKSQLTGTATVTIDIDDVNDNPPTFDQSEYTKKILETAVVGQEVVQLSATDLDEGINQQFKYRLTQNYSELFKLNESNGLISVGSNLTNIYGNFSLSVEAVDTGNLSSIMNVTIFVEDVNNNRPTFVDIPSSVKIYECARNGSKVLTLSSKDLDHGQNSEVRYSMRIITGDNRTFTINSKNGEIRIVKKLNAQEITQYRLRVEVKDHGSPSLSSEADLTVYVIDVNDHPPVFPTNQSQTHVYENEANITIFTVQATDIDINSEIEYSIVENFNSSFEIDRTSGNLKVIKSLDREKRSKVTIKVQATDVSSRNISQDCDNKTEIFYNNTQMNIVVNVLDVNDNAPQFNDRRIRLGIRRTIEVDTIILDFKQYVNPDPDLGDNRIHSFDLNGNISFSSHSLQERIESIKKRNVDRCPESQKLTSSVCLTSNGTLVSNVLFEEDMKGYLVIPVIVTDAAGNDTATLKLDLISDDQTGAILIFESKNFVQTNQKNILSILSRSTGKTFVGDGIKSKTTNGIAEAGKTYLYFHVIDPKDGSISSAAKAKSLIDQHTPELRKLKTQYYIDNISEYKDTLPKDDKTGIKEKYILLGGCALLGMTVIILGICFGSSVTKYKRKIKAATTTANVDADATETQPGTNLYARNKNPMYDKDVNSEPVDYNRFEDNLSIASFDAAQFSQKDTTRDLEEKGATLDIYDDEEMLSQGDADALAMVLDRHKRQKAASQESLVSSRVLGGYSASEGSFNGMDNDGFDHLETTEV